MVSNFSAVSPPVFELLAAHHDRQGFDCGEASLNDFLRQRARQNTERSVGITHVAVASAGDTQILGYYTLLVRTVEKDLFPAGKKLPPGPIGVVLLGRLAVSRTAQGQGLGTLMLLRAIRQTERAAREMGIYALVLHALNDAACNWYLGLNFGFETLLDDPYHLFLPVATIRQLGLSPP
jgi:GNAT superfamily N-acetyltransferase